MHAGKWIEYGRKRQPFKNWTMSKPTRCNTC